ncbi:MAG TPA: hypothetical protein VK506_08780 [Conexibacter sp.]|nr:hypothetical protein [Conexibacter sp.]
MARVGPAQHALLTGYVEARRQARGKPFTLLFVTAHIKRAVRTLLEAYAERAVLVPEDDPLDEWLETTREELQAYVGQLPDQPLVRLYTSLQTPLLSIGAGALLTTLGLRLSDLCICYLFSALSFAVPCSVLIFIPGAAANASRLLSSAQGGGQAFAHERELAAALELPLRRQLPWEAICCGGSAIWFLSVPSIFGAYVHDDANLLEVFAGGFALVALGLLVHWLATGGLTRVKL